MEDFTPEQLRSMFQKMLEITACAVCLETVSGPDVMLCVNEHMLCGSCREDLTNCPTCSQPFSAVKPQRLFAQVLETLPHCCRHENCPQQVIGDDDHETYCGWRPTQCKLCNTTVLGKDIYAHVSDKHPSRKIFTETLLPDRYMNFNSKMDLNSFSFFKVSGHTFWKKTAIHQCKGKPVLIHNYQYTPNGKPNCNIFIEIEFNSTETTFKSKIRFNTNPDTYDENVIIVPVFMLSDFMSDDRKALLYNTKVTFK
uniref:RING-type domain-containing protein n=1 Tax=Graphocephala atropunctata TaxID=36148 RepID=A0A1B6LF22_9HEMI